MLMATTGRSEYRALDCIQILLKGQKRTRDQKGKFKTLRFKIITEPDLVPMSCQSLCPDIVTHLVWNQGQPHALQVFALLAEDKMTLFGFRNDEIELHLFTQHGGGECEGMKAGVRHLHLQRRRGECKLTVCKIPGHLLRLLREAN